MAQHKVVAGPNEVARQGCCHHVVVAYDYASLHPDDKRTLQHDAAQICNE